MNKKYDDKITIYGSKKDIDEAVKVLNDIDVQGYEHVSRMRIQENIDAYNLKASILYDGGTVWSRKKVVAGVKRVKNNGMKSMTKYLYKFLTLACGSIAHYNIYGWIDEYPTIEDFRNFFLRNEFGERVKNRFRDTEKDNRLIVEDIEEVLGIE
jgi:hypothetical protein|tara:strand:+ start:36315 stop:36776 length:462 start_codon:yes stop_codon:yes gene_type:complete